MQGICIYISSKIFITSFIYWMKAYMTLYTYKIQKATCRNAFSHFTCGSWRSWSKILSLDDYKLYPLSHLTSPKVMFTTLRYWSDSNSALPQAHDVPKSSRKNTPNLILAKYIIRCSTTRGKEGSVWKAEDTDSARLLLTPDDVFWCCSGWTWTMMREEADDFHYNWDRCKISREQCFSCYPLEE